MNPLLHVDVKNGTQVTRLTFYSYDDVQTKVDRFAAKLCIDFKSHCYRTADRGQGQLARVCAHAT